MSTLVKYALTEHNMETIEGIISVQGLSVFVVVTEDEIGIDMPTDAILSYNIEKQKWVDDRGCEWDGWDIEND